MTVSQTKQGLDDQTIDSLGRFLPHDCMLRTNCAGTPLCGKPLLLNEPRMENFACQTKIRPASQAAPWPAASSED